MDRKDKISLFSFKYREATDEEKEDYKLKYQKEVEKYKTDNAEASAKHNDIFSFSHLFEPSENPLTAYVDWKINIKKLKGYLSELLKVYENHLKDKDRWTGENLKELDDIAKDMEIVPSSFINSFKKGANIETWKDFIDNMLGADSELTGKVHVGERDFDPEDYFFPPTEIENILFYKASEILKENLNWKEIDHDNNNYSVIEHCFKNSWEGLLQRIATINYVSNIKEENARSYNATSNSPFIKLLKSYKSEVYFGNRFMEKYLKRFEIGKSITVNFDPKYQSIFVSIKTMDGHQRELVDFGYGIKQLVLIILQITVLAQKNLRSEHVYGYDGETIEDTYIPSLLIIEEPESNLHPKWQSVLADMFAEANSRFNIQLMIETHSEYLIRKFQTLVAKKELSANSVKIFYLRNRAQTTQNRKQIDSLFIEEDGSIDYKLFDNGFFDENYNLEMGLLNVQRDNFITDFEKLKNDHQDNENKILLFQQQIDAFVDKADVSKYQLIIDNEFTVSKLDPITVSYLSSGQFLLHNINTIDDFSPVIIQYGRAIENELKRIFVSIPSPNQWMLGSMQKQLENYSNGNAHNLQLPSKLINLFNNPSNLRIDLINDLRDIRNDAGHSGHIKIKQEAVDYIQNVNDFLQNWITELK